MPVAGGSNNTEVNLTVNIKTKAVSKAKEEFDKAGKEGRRFNMELLGIMFAGMALYKGMQGLLSGAAEMTGVFQILSTAMAIFFLPIMLALLPLILWFAEVLINADDSTKKFIGTIVIILMAFGFLLFVVGQLGLGFQALYNVVGFVGKAFAGTLAGSAGATYSLLITIVVAIVAIIIIIALLALAWKYNFANIRGWAEDLFFGLSRMFDGFIDLFGGLFDLLIAIINQDGEGILEACDRITIGLAHVLEGLGFAVIAILGFIVQAILNVIEWIITAVGKLTIWLVDEMAKVTDSILEALGLADLLSPLSNISKDIRTRFRESVYSRESRGGLAGDLGFSSGANSNGETLNPDWVATQHIEVTMNNPVITSEEDRNALARQLADILADTNRW